MKVRYLVVHILTNTSQSKIAHLYSRANFVVEGSQRPNDRMEKKIHRNPSGSSPSARELSMEELEVQRMRSILGFREKTQQAQDNEAQRKKSPR